MIEAPAIVPAAQLRRSKLSRRLARRIDRLSRRAHRFHRFAHHPLCDRYAGEVVRVGRRVRLCRGCTFAVAGGGVGGVVGLALGASSAAATIALASGTAVLLATLWSRVRIAKTVTRMLPAACFALAITCGVLAWSAAGLALAAGAVAMVIGLRVLYGRRGADRTPCTTCPERELAPCSGMAAIVSRERAFQRVVAGWIAEDQAIRRSAMSSGDGPRIERSR
ncbi:MAG TPA: hypothetical protein VLX92_34530 [Kofleriaceae bacterium]|nr:hypothetical protein [Kofleriaceae bacterium]